MTGTDVKGRLNEVFNTSSKQRHLGSLDVSERASNVFVYALFHLENEKEKKTQKAVNEEAVERLNSTRLLWTSIKARKVSNGHERGQNDIMSLTKCFGTGRGSISDGRLGAKRDATSHSFMSLKTQMKLLQATGNETWSNSGPLAFAVSDAEAGTFSREGSGMWTKEVIAGEQVNGGDEKGRNDRALVC